MMSECECGNECLRGYSCVLCRSMEGYNKRASHRRCRICERLLPKSRYFHCLECVPLQGELPSRVVTKVHGKFFYDLKGKSLTMEGWAKELKVPVGTLKNRIRRGWTLEETLVSERFK